MFRTIWGALNHSTPCIFRGFVQWEEDYTGRTRTLKTHTSALPEPSWPLSPLMEPGGLLRAPRHPVHVTH